MNINNLPILDDAESEKEVEARKSAETSLSALLETIPIGIVFTDRAGQITDLNAEMLRMFGYTRQELVGQSIEKLLPDRFRNSHKEQRLGYTKQPHARP